MKAIDVTDDSYAEYNEDFAKRYTANWSEEIFEIFVVGKIKNTVPWTYVINDLNSEEISGSFSQKELQKTSQQI